MRELTYTVPYERLTKLGRSMGRRAFPRMWWGRWLLMLTYFAVLIVLTVYISAIIDWMYRIGVPSGILRYAYLIIFGFSIVFFMVMLILMRKSQIREMKARVNFDQTARLVQEDNGIRIGTDTIEYYLKWQGISQLLIEPDGVVISHGSLFWLIPDTAFASPADRLRFIRDVYGRLNDRARSISESHVKPLLG